MDLALNADQQAIVELFGGFFAKEVPLSRVRQAEPFGFDAALWRQVNALGIPSMAVSGGTCLDMALVAEQAGRHLAPVPVVETLAANGLLHALAGPAVESGLVTLAVRPAGGGTARLVPAGAVAELVLVLDGDAVVAVRPGPSRSSPPNLGASPLADVAVEGTVLVEGQAAVRAHRRAVAAWQVLTASALAGLAGAALDLGVAYVKGRRQFGVPIGSFQAVQHRLADVATAVDGARLTAYRAAWALDTDEGDALERAATAMLFAGETAQRATSASLQFHGGYGFMLEYDIQLYHRRAKAWTLAGGDPLGQLDRIADLRYGPVTG